jgi:hypothetical protein
MGDAIWPEENFAMVVWCEPDEARGIERAVNTVKKVFPDEGIKLFGMPDPNIVQYAVPLPLQPEATAPLPRKEPELPGALPGFGGEQL